MKKILPLLVLTLLINLGHAQTSEGVATPKSMWEIGLHGGSPFLGGEVNPQLGYGFGLSVRKSVDYLFSIRAEGFYGQLKGKRVVPSREHTTDFMAVNVVGILSLNGVRFDRPIRKTNIYVLGGVGINRTRVEFMTESVRRGFFDWENYSHGLLGAGIAFRLGTRLNIALEHQSGIILGPRADLLDGVEFNSIGEKSAFGDSFNYTNIRFNFNIGKKGTKSEPLYWLNPLQVVLDDINQMKGRAGGMDIADSDDDGVIDALDKEPDTPEDAIVDTKGRTLDSDRDGVPDHIDKQPYYTPMPGERITSEGVVDNPIAGVGGSGGVTEARVRELIDEAFSRYQSNVAVNGGDRSLSVNGVAGANGAVGMNGAAGANGVSVTDLFLPMIHFGSNSSNVKYADYGTLATIARLMKGNATLRIAIIGHADQTGDEAQNDVLSYDRANAVVEHLVNNHDVARGRLLLTWRGQTEPLVPSTNSYMNRRVEFRVAAPNEIEMDPPATSDSEGY